MTIEDIRWIYSHIVDAISKEVYMARLSTSITFDNRYILELSDELKTLSKEAIEFKKQLSGIKKERIVMFGAGFNGQYFANQLLKGKVNAFIDNFPREKNDKINGILIYKPEEYIKKYGIKKTSFVISVGKRDIAEQLYMQLLNYEVDKKDIIIAPADYRNNAKQYFDVFSPYEQEVFVDCGAYDGSTALGFVRWCGDKNYEQVYCFEPDIKSYENIKKQNSKRERFNIFPFGVSNEEKEVQFISNGNEDAHIKNDKENICDCEIIKTIKLDNAIGNKRVTFIKMDIEGEEYKALEGAKNIIEEQKPRLAISVYHKNTDIMNIPKLLLELVPEYKFIFRHYSILTNETILYAYV